MDFVDTLFSSGELGMTFAVPLSILAGVALRTLGGLAALLPARRRS